MKLIYLQLGTLVSIFGMSELARSATIETILHRFCNSSSCMDGSSPSGGLLQAPNGDFFGVTTYGGNTTNGGTVFQLSRTSGSWKYKVIHQFCALDRCADGKNPVGGLAMDAKGNLYGTTTVGGIKYGVAFKMSPSGSGWNYSVIYNFCSVSNSKNGCKDGGSPTKKLLIDSGGTLFGTANIGGNQADDFSYGDGTIFSLTPPVVDGGKWTHKVLHVFCPAIDDCPDGASGSSGELSELSKDESGAFFGVAPYGGANYGGTLYKLLPPTGTIGWKYTVIYAFCANQNWPGPCLDGKQPTSLALKNGSVFVATSAGGSKNGGAIIQLSKPLDPRKRYWLSNKIYDFCLLTNCRDGNYPIDGIEINQKGQVFGTTRNSGPGGSYSNYGTVFRLSPPTTTVKSWSLLTLHGFCTKGTYADPCTDGSGPIGGVTIGKDGSIYGTTDYFHPNIYKLSGF